MRRPTRPRSVAAIAVGAAPALAGAPSNDSFAHARHIAGVPATITDDSNGASGQSGEPTSDCDNGGGSASVWYWVKVSSATDLLVDLKGTAFAAGLSVWKGSSLATLHEVECARDETILSGGPARLAFRAAAGTRYYFQVSDQYGSNAGGAIKLSVKKTTPPANDAFSHAKAISLPFIATVSNAKSTTQSGEPETEAMRSNARNALVPRPAAARGHGPRRYPRIGRGDGGGGIQRGPVDRQAQDRRL